MPSTAQALALVAALLSAVATIAVRKGLRDSDSYTALWINVLVGTIGFWIAALFTGAVARPSLTGIVYFALAALYGEYATHPVVTALVTGVGAAGAGLFVATAIKLGKPLARKPAALALILATFLAVAVGRLSLLYVMPAALLVAYLVSRRGLL